VNFKKHQSFKFLRILLPAACSEMMTGGYVKQRAEWWLHKTKNFLLNGWRRQL